MKLHVNARCVQRMLALVALGTTLSLVGAPVLAAEPPHGDPLFDRKFLLYYLTRPEYQIHVREAIYLDNMLDLF